MSIDRNRARNFYIFNKRWIVWTMVLAITVVCVFCVKLFYAIILYSPDDWMFEALLSGKFTGEPCPYLYFQKFPFSSIISNLYNINGTIPWYSIMLLGGVSISFFLVVERIIIIEDVQLWIRICFSVLLFGILFVNQFVFVEWTRTAGCILAAALFRLITVDINKTKWGRCIDLLSIVGLLFWCFCLRHTIFLMGSPFLALSILVLTLKYRKQKSHFELISIWVFVIVTIFGVCGCSFLHAKAYDSDEWKAYDEYTNNRSVLMDLYGFPDYDEHKELYEELGISRSAYELLSARCYIIPEDEFSEKNIARLAEVAKTDNKESLQERANTAYNLALKSLKTSTLFAIRIFTIFTAFGVIFCVKKWYTIVWLLGGVGIAGLLLWYGRFPMYVELSLFLILLLGELAFAINNGCRRKELAKNRKNIVKIAMSLIALIKYARKHPDNIYIRDFYYSQLPEGLFDPDYYWSDNYVSSGGWGNKTPPYEIFEERLGITSINNYLDENGEIYYLIPKSVAKKFYYSLKQYFDEKRNDIEIKRICKIKNTNGDIAVYRISVK